MGSQTQPQTQQSLPWWWPHLFTALCALIAIMLGALDHFIASDRWGMTTDLMLIGAGLLTGGVSLGHFVGWPQQPPQ